MAAVLLRLHAELRAGWRAWLGLALLLGIASGAAIAAAAGARRTESAYPRFLASQRAMDLVLDPDVAEGAVEGGAFRTLARLPQIADSSVVYLVPAMFQMPRGTVASFGADVFPLLDPSGRFGVEINRVKITEGRMWNARRPNEAVVGVTVARRFGIEVGSAITMMLSGIGPDGMPTGEPVARERLRVVGIGVSPGEFQPLASGHIPAVHLSPALYHKYEGAIPVDEGGLVVRLRRGEADVEPMIAAARSAGIPLTVGFSQFEQTEGVQRSNRFHSTALWLAASIVAAVGLALFGQALSRAAHSDADEHAALAAVGMTGRQLVGLTALRAAIVGLVAAAGAVVIAVAASPLTPTGPARLAEPDPGLRVDGAAVGIGAAATVALAALVSLIPGWRAARLAGIAGRTVGSGHRPSRAADALARAGMPPTAVTGVRLALTPGRGASAVPARATIAGATLGILALAAALTFRGALDHLLATPSLGGWNWDIAAEIETAQRERALDELARHPSVAAAVGGDIIDVEIGSDRMLAVVTEPGPFGPSVIEGRVPSSASEVALGTITMRSRGLRIGDSVRLKAFGDNLTPGKIARLRVVGRVALPGLFFSFVGTGKGAALSAEGMRRLVPPGSLQYGALFVRTNPGVDAVALGRELSERIPSFFPIPRREDAAVASLGDISEVPVVLAGVLATLAAATLAHTLASSVRRRRRDLAMLATLGFVRGQVRGAVAWQASTVAVLALAAGVPLGVVAGWWGWNLFADQLGVVPAQAVPALALGLAAPFAVLLANVVAALPARAAARMRPALVLRAE